MSAPEATVRAFFGEMWNAHDLDAFPRFVAPDVVFRHPRGPPTDHEGYCRMARDFISAFPDLRFDIEQALSVGDLVALRIRIRGTHEGVWRGFAPTRRRIDVVGQPWARVRDGKVVEFFALWDELGAMQQLGLVADMLVGGHAGPLR